MIISYVEVRYEADMKCFIPNRAIKHLAKVPLLNESTFRIKVCRWCFSSCVFFTDAQRGIWSLPASQKRSHGILDDELFISVFSSEPRVCVIIRAGYRTSIHECRPQRVLSIENTTEVWTGVTTWTRVRAWWLYTLKKQTNCTWPLMAGDCLTWSNLTFSRLQIKDAKKKTAMQEGKVCVSEVTSRQTTDDASDDHSRM